MSLEFPALPYDRSALAPHISAETVDFHHGKHTRHYFDETHRLVASTPLANAPLEEIVRKAQGRLFENAAQAWNHRFYWNGLKPAGRGAGKPDGRLLELIERQFGDFGKFKDEFSRLATGLFGSGWTWLVQRPSGQLALVATTHANTPLTGHDTPLLVLDTWEHAYYIDQRNARAKYVEAFWNIVNWDFVASNLA